MIPLRPFCDVCGPFATHDKAISKCTRCEAVFYCGRDHQRQDYAHHKGVCIHVKKWRELIQRETAALQALVGKGALPPDLFARHAGHFYSIEETRPLMRAKLNYIRGLFTLGTQAGVTLALDEALDCLRLSRSDSMGVRDVVPALMLQLGQLQRCYDFIRWYATSSTDSNYDWHDLALQFLDVKDADMTENILPEFSASASSSSVFHLAALTYIKMKLVEEIDRLLDQSKPLHAHHTFRLLTGDAKPRTLRELTKLQAKLKIEAVKGFRMVHARNSHYWAGVLDPVPLQCEDDPGYFQRGDRFEVKVWIVPQSMLWNKQPKAMAFIRDNLKLIQSP